ncbi:MAG: hypothetical protein NTX49_10335 [Chlamydiae bacterium]|nr:hypothetical protein [Chlamydiota bacterium]
MAKTTKNEPAEIKVSPSKAPAEMTTQRVLTAEGWKRHVMKTIKKVKK